CRRGRRSGGFTARAVSKPLPGTTLAARLFYDAENPAKVGNGMPKSMAPFLPAPISVFAKEGEWFNLSLTDSPYLI
ncbi:MAG: hypothetical protein LBB65_08660, partial [Burkholderiales bacterium]|nr:hypothetical protein [Burkholderiales bacterium]